MKELLIVLVPVMVMAVVMLMIYLAGKKKTRTPKDPEMNPCNARHGDCPNCVKEEENK